MKQGSVRMMVRLGALPAVVALAACGGAAPEGASNAANAASAPPAANAATPAPETASAPAAAASDTAADEAALRRAVDAIYADYEGKSGGAQPLSADFQKAWDRALGPDGALDYDPWCDCQDYNDARFRHRIVSIDVKGDAARVALQFDVGWDAGWRPKWIAFARTPSGWVIDDMGSEGGDSMKAAMARAEPGSWGIGG